VTTNRTDDLRWSPAPGLVALAWLGALAAVAWCLLLAPDGTDPAGRLIVGVAAVALLVAAVSGTVARPRLAAGADGLAVRSLAGTRRYPWPQVHRIRVLHTRRFGRVTSLLAVDVRGDEPDDERLIVFGRLDLGADPEDVAAALTTRYRA
jgi:hypothetical protein